MSLQSIKILIYQKIWIIFDVDFMLIFQIGIFLDRSNIYFLFNIDLTILIHFLRYDIKEKVS